MALRDRFRRIAQKPGSVDLAPYEAVVAEAGAREDRVRALSDAELTAAATALRARPRQAEALAGKAESGSGKGAGKAAARAGKPVDLAELCALGREAARRTLGERPYDVQLLGTLGLLSGQVVEMATGEGKTLAGALAAAGYALRGEHVHVMSVNDYLARRDAEWMGPLYAMLGVTVASIGESSTPAERRAAYAADVTYAPVSEIGFDLLRDRLVTATADRVLPEPAVALIDEADSVLVDEAMVPLVLAGASDLDPADPAYADLVRRLRPGQHYATDDEGRNVQLTAAGAREVEHALGDIDLYASDNTETLVAVNVALHAQVLLKRDVDYIVRDGAVKLINASRGRVAMLQRWPDGLQAAVEAKEELETSESGEILDSVTVQEFIGRYPTRCGMTGTAIAVADQLREFYNLEIAVIPPNRPRVREDQPDRLYATATDKEVAIVEEIASSNATGRPVLVGTLDVAESERLARRLDRAGLTSVVLNAKNDAEEASIIAEAGALGAITVSTQMAGRGTDIRLGGTPPPTPELPAPEGTTPEATTRASAESSASSAPADAGRSAAAGTAPCESERPDAKEVAGLGGLLVIGTGRYHGSRLDDQLRGRSGRQGDPGGSIFFVSLEDDLITQYAPDEKLKVDADADGRVHDKGAEWVVGHAQRVAEGVDLEIHRNTWRYNQLIGLQRRELLVEREQLLLADHADRVMAERCPEKHAELTEIAGEKAVAEASRQVALYHLDRCWTEHLAFLTDLREGIHLRSLGRGLDPLSEFNREAVPAGKRLLGRAVERTTETFETLTATPDGVDLSNAGLKRPSATWTYLVHDNPFGSLDERALRGLIAMFRRKARK
ncbi:accessory Sec system translocase SecA2 [Actinomadura barringtoniae]|uniref:Protein translocase subunit SecA n=1 Tax=Actinomadura barringtoniae TaxID=1427535 RepID=A0A939P708_9ACTN|nr:accessory Sec system translocase SecA2 [Actinomadura barringtoniae]MBO2446623.1 accessory Sec system translocase SecA2 [Actinomadura barringtoniae]